MIMETPAEEWHGIIHIRRILPRRLQSSGVGARTPRHFRAQKPSDDAAVAPPPAVDLERRWPAPQMASKIVVAHAVQEEV
jgi:hypothetical protein